MNFAIVCGVFYVALQEYIQFTVSISQCSTDQYVGINYAPIDLKTSDAIEVPCVTPLLFTFGDSERLKITNTGSALEITLNQKTTVTSISGGVLGQKIFVFHKIRYYWDHDFTGDAAYTVDQSGYPLNSEFIYYNAEYGSFANAFNQPEGLVIARASLNVEGTIPNAKFNAFQNLLSTIRKAGSSCEINGSIREVVYSWYDQITVNYPFYYSYAGSYYEYDNENTQIFDAIFLVAPKCVTGFLSICQFAAFTNLLNYAGTPISIVQPAYPSRGRNITQAAGVAEKIVY